MWRFDFTDETGTFNTFSPESDVFNYCKQVKGVSLLTYFFTFEYLDIQNQLASVVNPMAGMGGMGMLPTMGAMGGGSVPNMGQMGSQKHPVLLLNEKRG